MTRKTINIGSKVNDKTGDPLRTAFSKINDNFAELYALTGGSSADLQELAQDYAAKLFVDGNHTGVTVTYDDQHNKINITMNDIDGGGA